MDIEEQYDKIYRYCYFKLLQQHIAEDITQETFLRFLESATYRNTGQVLQYLYTVARNLCIDEYRRKAYELLPGDEEGHHRRIHDRTEPDMEEKLLTSIVVREALEDLCEEDRELMLLRYVNEVPVSVISRLLGISRFAVYRRTQAILKSLQDKLGKEDFQ
ncbi:RNA polymerase sigma-70 factor (ECF subfamily) [Kineothrix alysoides]|uniref:RNA polymerase sigma-70 factor (ECF subfamily) n=1 Tax=Kineothrix alysoides TaxID=1469948 RepID=A0A4R1QYM6_9FIRM|nr:sigma-70 family RNA polymerase sigma factor [Kineothrix alysoides]TCL58066.1 RNA polymerase sigma-70 factor (ECF subfamily) [Kineothrix alysoides]